MRPRRHSDLSADLLGSPLSVRRCIRIGEFLVAAATLDMSEELEGELNNEHERLGLSADDHRGLVEEFAAAADAMPAGWGYVALCSIAVNNRWLSFDQLLTGSNHVRIDALFDRVVTNYCAHEVQAEYLGCVEILREASKSGWMKAGEWTTVLGGGFAGGFFGFGGRPAAKAAEWLNEHGTSPTDLTFELANFALAWDHLTEADAFYKRPGRSPCPVPRPLTKGRSPVWRGRCERWGMEHVEVPGRGSSRSRHSRRLTTRERGASRYTKPGRPRTPRRRISTPAAGHSVCNRRRRDPG